MKLRRDAEGRVFLDVGDAQIAESPAPKPFSDLTAGVLFVLVGVGGMLWVSGRIVGTAAKHGRL